MDYIMLGRTGLKVTVMGIGCGGPSRIGQRTGKTRNESVNIIQQALDAGINFIDTSERYGTEGIIGQALEGYDRDSLILSTKKSTKEKITPKNVATSLKKSLKLMKTDYIDIYHLHGVRLENYEYLLSEIVPFLQNLRDEGKIRFIGITEGFSGDPQHAMFQRALQDDVWDVIGVGFNILNQSARDRVFIKTIEKNIGVMNMFAVRRALSNPEKLVQVIEELIERKQVDPKDIDLKDPLGFLVYEEGATSVVDAAYRFCHFERGTHVILSGTGNPDHLKANIESFYRPPLPIRDQNKLKRIFRFVDSVSGN